MYEYAEPEIGTMDAISAYEKAANPATVAARINEIITDGPANFAAASPLNTNIPVPANQSFSSISKSFEDSFILPIILPMPKANN